MTPGLAPTKQQASSAIRAAKAGKPTNSGAPKACIQVANACTEKSPPEDTLPQSGKVCSPGMTKAPR